MTVTDVPDGAAANGPNGSGRDLRIDEQTGAVLT